MKGIQKYELTVLIEKNLSTNERKLKKEIEKLLSQSAQLREVRLVQLTRGLGTEMQTVKTVCIFNFYFFTTVTSSLPSLKVFHSLSPVLNVTDLLQLFLGGSITLPFAFFLNVQPSPSGLSINVPS